MQFTHPPRPLQQLYRPARLALALLLPLGLAACDSNGSGAESDVTVGGRVTDNPGASKSAADISGAVVTALRVDGSTAIGSTTATTTAEGRYALAVDAAPAVFLVSATKAAFTSRVVVVTQGRSSIEAAPMTIETRAEADTYTQTQTTTEGDDVTPADVAAHIQAQAAASLSGNATQTQAFGRALVRAVRTGSRVAAQQGASASASVREKLSAYAEYQASAAAGNAAQAETALLNTYANAYVKAGADARGGAQALQVQADVLARTSSEVSTSLLLAARKRAETAAARATAAALRARFQAQSAAQARIDAVTQAEQTFVASLNAATSASAVTQARVAFGEAVAAQVNAQSGSRGRSPSPRRPPPRHAPRSRRRSAPRHRPM